MPDEFQAALPDVEVPVVEHFGGIRHSEDEGPLTADARIDHNFAVVSAGFQRVEVGGSYLFPHGPNRVRWSDEGRLVAGLVAVTSRYNPWHFEATRRILAYILLYFFAFMNCHRETSKHLG